MSVSLREKAFWACAEGEDTEVRRQVPIVDALVARAEAQVQRILGLSDPCQVMLVQLAPDATTVEPLGTVVVQLDDVSLVFNRAHGPYGYQTGQVYLAQQDDERWQLVGDPIEDLADLGRERCATHRHKRRSKPPTPAVGGFRSRFTHPCESSPRRACYRSSRPPWLRRGRSARSSGRSSTPGWCRRSTRRRGTSPSSQRRWSRR